MRNKTAQSAPVREGGFSPFLVIIGIFVVAIIVLIAVQIMHAGDNKKPAKTPAGKTSNSAQAGGSQASGRKSDPSEFAAIPSKLDLLTWKVHLTAPTDSASKLVYKYQSNELFYVLSTRNIINDQACVSFYNNSISPPGLELQRYSAGMLALNAFPAYDPSDTTTTLTDYYVANKAPDGNYFVGPNNDDDPTVIQSRWYNIGNFFYTIQMPSLSSSYTQGFAINCTHEAADYYDQFEQMLTTIAAD